MNTAPYCLDANVFITAWNYSYLIDIFPSLWRCIAEQKENFAIIKPIFDEIEDGDLKEWLQDKQFPCVKLSDGIKAKSLVMQSNYQTKENSSGAGKVDMDLIAYAWHYEKIVVTFESKQNQKPEKKCNYKIPLICQEQEVQCIDFVELLKKLKVKI